MKFKKDFFTINEMAEIINTGKHKIKINDTKFSILNIKKMFALQNECSICKLKGYFYAKVYDSYSKKYHLVMATYKNGNKVTFSLINNSCICSECLQKR